MTESRQKTKSSLWTPSNIITIARICLVPIFVVALLSPWPEWFALQDIISPQIKSIIAVCIFVLISCTDWLDGYLARSRNEITDFGKFADPLADKILVIAALLALVELEVLPSWPVLIIITREFIVSGIRMLAATRGVVIAASWYGKAKTVTQIIAIVLFLVKDSVYFPEIGGNAHEVLYIVAWIAMVVALVLTVISMLDYIVKAWPMLSGSVQPQVSDACGGSPAVNDASPELASAAQRAVSACLDGAFTVGTAESLTGGMITSALTSVPGSSQAVKGGVVSYAISVKEDILGVDPVLLNSEGAVNAQTAIEMACGCRQALGCDIAVSATGIAGPGGAEPGKPVGMVFIGFSTRLGSGYEQYLFEGDRHTVRESTVACALGIVEKQAYGLKNQ